MSDHESRLDELFTQASSLPRDAREEFIERECAADPELASALRRLLEHDVTGSDRFLEGEQAQDSPARASHVLPDQIGSYRIIREIGRGGMGVVYEALQQEPERRVALKIVRSPFLSGSLISRFRREAHVLGQLQHRGIAHIYESGSATVGRDEVPYFAMEYIDGLPLNQHVAQHGLGIRDRLELLARVCDAVEHAHQKGIIHRDLKPANVLVVAEGTEDSARSTRESGALASSVGQPKILDFGIARFTGADGQATLQTSTGQIVGTLAYMSPEQVDGRPEHVDTRSDVYALGVMMYTLLADRAPHDFREISITEAARVIRDDEPDPLSTIDGTFRGDLTTIAQKAMEKDPDRRYASAGQLADDIRRYLANEPIAARPASTLYQFSKFAKRNKALVGGVAAAIVLLAGGVIGTSIGLARALDANQQLIQRNEELAAVSAYQATQLEDVDPQAMGTTLRQYLLDSVPDSERDALADSLADINFTTGSLRLLDAHLFTRAEQAIDTEFQDRPITRSRLLHSLGLSLNGTGLHESAIRVLTTTLTLREQQLGENHQDTLDTMAALGQALLDGEETSEARAIQSKRLQRIETAYGQDSLTALAAQNSLANILIAEREYKKAEGVLRPLVARLTEVADPQSDELNAALGSLAIAVGHLGDDNEAMKLLESAIEGRSRLLGEKHPKTLTLKSNLAVRLESMGRLEEAEATSREVLAIRRQIDGDDHPSTLLALDNLAQLLIAVTQLDDAELLATEALERRRRLLGNRHPATLRSLNTLAAIIDTLGRYEEAEPMYREVYENFQVALGPEHPLTVSAMGNLGYVINVQGRHDEAEPFYRGAYEQFLAAYGPDDSRTLRAMGNYAVLLTNQGKLDLAEPLYRRSLETRQRLLGDTNPSTLIAMYNLGDFLIISGKPDEAEQYCTAALSGYRALGENHIGVLHSLGLVARMYEAIGDTDNARQYYEEATLRRSESLGDNHPLTQQARAALAELIPSSD